MKIIKNIFKILAIIFLIIIPICLILYSMFIDFLGCYVLFTNDFQIELLASQEGSVLKDIRIVFIDTDAEDGTNITLVNKDLIKNRLWGNSNGELVEYVKTNGIDLYNTVNIINYIYIIIVAIIIFFKKLLENADIFGKMEERDN